MMAILEVTEEATEAPMMPPVAFKMNQEAACHNSELLRDYNFDLNSLLSANKGSMLGYRSEFRPLRQIQKILKDHPHFPELTRILLEGMT